MRTYVSVTLRNVTVTSRWQVEEEESVVFSNIEVRVKRAGPSGLGDLEVTEYIARAHTQRAVRERGRRICPPGNDRSKIHA